tara:strand:- start:10575 stop:10697 length:123 start_codon:yes stop_codon:yes gene_type:complete
MNPNLLKNNKLFRKVLIESMKNQSTFNALAFVIFVEIQGV